MIGEQTEFREELWGGLVDHIRIDEKSSTVVFRGGSKLQSDIPCGVGERIDDIGAIGIRRDFKEDVLFCTRCYLDGYRQQLNKGEK